VRVILLITMLGLVRRTYLYKPDISVQTVALDAGILFIGTGGAGAAKGLSAANFLTETLTKYALSSLCGVAAENISQRHNDVEIIPDGLHTIVNAAINDIATTQLPQDAHLADERRTSSR